MTRFLYIFPAIMFALSALSIYVIFVMFQNPETQNHPKMAIFSTVLGIGASLYEFVRGIRMIQEISEFLKAGENK